MPVQTRQASQAASQMLQHQFNVNGSLHTPVSGGPTAHGWRESGNGMQLAHSQVFSNRAVQTTPANDTSTQRRVCIATPVEERMLAELASFEQGLSGGSPETSAPLEDPDGFQQDLEQQDLEAQRESDAALEEAEVCLEEAMAADEEQYHQSLLAEAVKHEQESFRKHLHHAADVMHDSSALETMSAAEISKVQAAAQRLLSVCAVAKDSIQQQEVQHLKQEVYQLQALNCHEKLSSDKLLEANRTLEQKNSDLMKRFESEAEKNCCCICMSAKRNAMLFPCMHMDFCNVCIDKHMARAGACPICRVPIRGVLPLHLVQ